MPYQIKIGRDTIEIPVTDADRDTYSTIYEALASTKVKQEVDPYYRAKGHWTVTPGLAALLMEKSYGRQLGRPTINLHRNRLRNGAFKFMSNGVRIARTGETCSGRHRLRAIMEEGISTEMDFEFGDDRESACQCDDIKPWSAKDNITTGAPDLTNAPARASAARLLLIIKNRSRPDRLAVASYVMTELNNPVFDKAMSIGNRLKSHEVTTHMVGTVAAYLLFRVESSTVSINRFFEELITGSGMGETGAAVRSWIVKHKGGRDQSRDARLVAAVIELWNAYKNPRSRATQYSKTYITRKEWNFDEFPEVNRVSKAA